jgi:hypothetical protein
MSQMFDQLWFHCRLVRRLAWPSAKWLRLSAAKQHAIVDLLEPGNFTPITEISTQRTIAGRDLCLPQFHNRAPGEAPEPPVSLLAIAPRRGGAGRQRLRA